MPPVGFEPTISAGERPQTYALDRAATGSGIYVVCLKSKCTDFPMYELVASHLIDVYWRVGSDLGCM